MRHSNVLGIVSRVVCGIGLLLIAGALPWLSRRDPAASILRARYAEFRADFAFLQGGAGRKLHGDDGFADFMIGARCLWLPVTAFNGPETGMHVAIPRSTCLRGLAPFVS